MKGVLFEELVLDAFDQLSPFYTLEKTSSVNSSISASLSQSYLSIKSQISVAEKTSDTDKQQRILPPQLTPQALGRFIGASGCCWVLEDFHKIDESERAKLSQVMKVFMDLADEYPTLKIVAIGAVDTARQVVEHDAEMENRVAEIHVPLMLPAELRKIIEIGCNHLNIKFDDNLSAGIATYSNGMASICHHLCLNVCISKNILNRVSNPLTFNSNSLSDALATYLDECSDSLKKVFDNAFKQDKTIKFDNAKLILKAISGAPQEGAVRSEIYTSIKNDEPKYPQGNLTSYLEKLIKQDNFPILRFDELSGRYSFIDPIYRAFALAYFESNDPKKYGKKSIGNEISFSVTELNRDEIARIALQSIYELLNKK